MNILLMISKNDRYGAQRIFLDQAAVLQSMGNRIVVVGKGTIGYVADSVGAMGIEYHGMLLSGIGDLFRLVRLVRSRGIDIIHTTLDRADYFGVILSLITRKPVLSTMMVPRYHPGFRFADKVVVLSEKLKKVLLAKGIKEERIRLIRPGIDVDRFIHPDPAKREAWRTRFNTDRYSTVFSHIASLIPRKGHLVSLELMAACKKLGEDPLLIITGDPLEGEYYQKLVETVSRLDLKDNVRFTGWTADTAEILSLSHVSLLPSENEALGIVLMEGMAAGAAIIAREGEGGAELIEEHGTGFLYHPERDIADLAVKIVELRRDDARYKVFSDGCRKKANDFFSLNVLGRELMNLYNQAGKRKL
jgi:glycosyltransferase involved in cell wall biosynthesis